MLLFRSLVIGLIAGCVVLLINMRPKLDAVATSAALARTTRPSLWVDRPSGGNATLIDVAHGVSPRDVSSLVKLDAGEHVASVGDVRVESDLAAGTMIADSAHSHASFIDLEVAGPSGKRRVLVLIH